MLFGTGGQPARQLRVFRRLATDPDCALSQGGEPCGILLGFGQLISANYQQQVVVQQANQRGELFIDCRVGPFSGRINSRVCRLANRLIAWLKAKIACQSVLLSIEKVWCSVKPCAAAASRMASCFPCNSRGFVAKQQIGRAQPFSELRAELFRVQPNHH